MGLGLLEHPRLFFEFLVGGFQLFLLHLQLFVELLGFGQHILQALTIAGTFNGGAEVVSDQLEQLDIALIQGAQEPQLDHAVDLPIVAGRHHQHAARQALAQAAADLEIVARQIVQAQQALLHDGLGQNTFLAADHLVPRGLLGRQPIGGDPAQAAVFVAGVQGAHGAAQVAGKKAQDIVAEHWQGQLPQHLAGQFGLPGAQPGLALQALVGTLLGLKAAGIAAGQRQQVAATQVGQQAAEQDDKHQVDGNRHHGGGIHRFVARDP
ncbi:hypothetical protein D3C80_1188470 [compost metagenome]